MRGSSAAQCTMQWISFTFLGFLQHWAWSVKLGWGEESSLEWILTIHPWFIKIWNVLASEKIRSGDTMQLASASTYLSALLHKYIWHISIPFQCLMITKTWSWVYSFSLKAKSKVNPRFMRTKVLPCTNNSRFLHWNIDKEAFFFQSKKTNEKVAIRRGRHKKSYIILPVFGFLV